MTLSTRISFVRHGEVDNPQGVFYGRLPGFALSAQGHREAQATARVLCRQQIAAIYASPLLRACQTAQAIQRLCPEVPLYVSRNLSEVYCPYDAQPHSVLDAIGWDVYAGTEPPYEQPGDLLARTLSFIAEARSDHAGRHVVAVTHGDVIAFLLLWVRDRPVTARNRGRVVPQGSAEGYPAHASITTLVYRTSDAGEHPTFEYMLP